jgi:hypothetical protein
MVRHQTPGPHLDAGGLAIFGEQVAIQRIVAVLEERTRLAIAALGDMGGMAGDDDTGETSPAASCTRRHPASI